MGTPGTEKGTSVPCDAGSAVDVTTDEVAAMLAAKVGADGALPDEAPDPADRPRTDPRAVDADRHALRHPRPAPGGYREQPVPCPR